MLRSPELQRAPGRGRYERHCSRADRFRAQRMRLLRATAVAHLEGDGSVARVIALSGVGRATFYECFDDFDHALATVRGEAGHRARRALALCSKQAELCELCSAWLHALVDEPLSALAALDSQRGLDSELLVSFRQALSDLFPVARGDARWLNTLACVQASARAAALTALGAAQVPATAKGSELVGPNVPVGLAVELLAKAIRCFLADDV